MANCKLLTLVTLAILVKIDQGLAIPIGHIDQPQNDPVHDANHEFTRSVQDNSTGNQMSHQNRTVTEGSNKKLGRDVRAANDHVDSDSEIHVHVHDHLCTHNRHIHEENVADNHSIEKSGRKARAAHNHVNSHNQTTVHVHNHLCHHDHENSDK